MSGSNAGRRSSVGHASNDLNNLIESLQCEGLWPKARRSPSDMVSSCLRLRRLLLDCMSPSTNEATHPFRALRGKRKQCC
jgi:hypothetical protein